MANPVGGQLRAFRLRSGLTLAELARRSGGEFKVSSLGAYERGDRSVTVARLQRLAEVYGVEMEAFFQVEPTPSIDLVALEQQRPGVGIVLDLSRFRTLTDESARAVMTFATAIKSMRRHMSSSVIIVRRSDAGLLASAIGCDPAELDQLLFSPAGAAPPTPSPERVG